MKPLIYATGNELIKGEFNISYYIIQKDSSFLDWLAKLLVEVFEIKDGEQKAKYIIKRNNPEEIDNEEEKTVENEIYFKEIDKMIDLHEHYENKGERIDIFYGKDRVYLTLRKSREIRKKFADFVKKTKDWIVVKEIKEMPLYFNYTKKHEKV